MVVVGAWVGGGSGVRNGGCRVRVGWESNRSSGSRWY